MERTSRFSDFLQNGPRVPRVAAVGLRTLFGFVRCYPLDATRQWNSLWDVNFDGPDLQASGLYSDFVYAPQLQDSVEEVVRIEELSLHFAPAGLGVQVIALIETSHADWLWTDSMTSLGRLRPADSASEDTWLRWWEEVARVGGTPVDAMP